MAGASGFLLGDDAVEFMRERGEQTWEAANEAGGCTAGWTDDCAQCGDDAGLRACCGYCHLVFHPACLDPPQDVENWDEVAFACGLCVTDAKAKPANTQGARLMRVARQQRATTAAADARRAARNKDIRDEHDAIALFVEQRAGGAAAAKRAAASAPPDPRRAHKRGAGASAGSPARTAAPRTPPSSPARGADAGRGTGSPRGGRGHRAGRGRGSPVRGTKGKAPAARGRGGGGGTKRPRDGGGDDGSVRRANDAARVRRVRQATAADAAADDAAANPSAAACRWSEEDKCALARGIVEHVVSRTRTVAVARVLGEPPQMRSGLVTLGAPDEDGCFAVVYGANDGAEEERGTLAAHDVFRYVEELPPPSFNDGEEGGRDEWWEAVRQRVPGTAVFVRSRTVTALRLAWYRIGRERGQPCEDGGAAHAPAEPAGDRQQQRVLLAREPGGPPPVPKAYIEGVRAGGANRSTAAVARAGTGLEGRTDHRPEELWRPQRHPTASSEEGRYTPRSRSHGQIPNTVPTIHLCQHPRCTVQPW